MGNQVAQFATIFDAFGCESAYNSSSATISIKDVPKGSRALIDRTLEEISHYDDTRNYLDGMAALCIADYIDDHVTPIKEETRLNTLHALGIMKDGRYIHQVLQLQKNNRSWHYSEVANTCSHFGEECTHRGINPDPERKGKRSYRKPNEFHALNGKGEIRREQLVTASLEEVFRAIPEERLISAKPMIDVTVDLRAFKKLPLDDQLRIIAELQETVA